MPELTPTIQCALRRPQKVGLRSLGIDGRMGLGGRENSHRMCRMLGRGAPVEDQWFWFCAAGCVPRTSFLGWSFGM